MVPKFPALVEPGRQAHIFEDGQGRYEVEELVDIADMLATHGRSLALGRTVEIDRTLTDAELN